MFLTVSGTVGDGVIYGRTDGDLRSDFTVTVTDRISWGDVLRLLFGGEGPGGFAVVELAGL